MLFYDEGWNARLRGEEYNDNATEDWQDGWLDCDEAIADGEEDVKEKK